MNHHLQVGGFVMFFNVKFSVVALAYWKAITLIGKALFHLLPRHATSTPIKLLSSGMLDSYYPTSCYFGPVTGTTAN
jgi:hypothetical protein